LKNSILQNKTILLYCFDRVFRSRIAEGGECVLYLYTATSKQVLRHGPGHWAKGQQDRATYKCPEVCVYVYGRWVRFTFGHDKENRGSPSIQVSHPIRRVHPPRRRATETQYRRKVLYSYSHFFPRGISLFPVLRVPPSSIIGTLKGFAVMSQPLCDTWSRRPHARASSHYLFLTLCISLPTTSVISWKIAVVH